MTEQETQAMLDEMEKDQNKGKTPFWTPKQGENNVRFLPPLKPNGEKLPYFHHKVHWIDGFPYECLNQTFVDKEGNIHEACDCPACKMSKKLYKMGEKGSEEHDLAYNLSAKDRYVFRIVDRKAEDQTKPEFYETGPSIFNKFFNIIKSGKYGNIVHPTEGRDFIIDRQGEGRRTNYDNSLPSPDKTKLHASADDMRKTLEEAVKMKYSDLVSFPSFDEIKTAVEEFINPGSTAEENSGMLASNKKSKSEDDVDFSSPSGVKEKEEKLSDNVNDSDVDDILGEFI